MTNLLTVEEAAAALHATVTVAAIRAAIREGRLAATRIGKRYYVEAALCIKRTKPPGRADE